MQWDHEIIIVGGGMVGAALAARLGQAGISVGLVERGSAPQTRQRRLRPAYFIAQRPLARVRESQRHDTARRALLPVPAY